MCFEKRNSNQEEASMKLKRVSDLRCKHLIRNTKVYSVFLFEVIHRYHLSETLAVPKYLIVRLFTKKHSFRKQVIAPIKTSLFAFKLALVLMISLTAEKAEGAAYAVTAIAVVPIQTGNLTYGTGGSVTYNVTLTESGNGNPTAGTTTLTLNWTDGAPTGVTFIPNTAVTLTGTGQIVTLTITSSATTPAATKSFTVTSSSGPRTSGSATFIVSQKSLSVTAPSVASKVYNATTASGAVTVGTLSGFVGIETVTATATGTYPDANVGVGKTATISYTLADGTNGGLASNYSLANGSAT